MSAPKTDLFKTSNTILIVLFIAIVWLPTIDSFLHLDKTPRLNENRAMAEKPVFNGLATTKEYLAGLELYFNDHFGYRQALVRMQSSWKRSLFKEAASGKAVIGNDGWIYTVSNYMIETYTGLSRFSEADLQAWQTLLENRRAWLEKRGIAYVVAVTPDKHTIYPEHLPLWLKPAPGPTKLDQWFEYFRRHSTFQPLDLRPVLLDAKKKEPVYMMTDTHWNAFGAYIGYAAVIKKLSSQVSSIKPLEENAFTLQPDHHRVGDLAILLGQEDAFHELQANTMVPSPHLSPVKIEETVRHEGRKHIAVTYARNDSATGKAIIFHDSFGVFWYPFFGQHFRETIFLSQREFDFALIEKEKPTIVIEQIVERIVDSLDPIAALKYDGTYTQSRQESVAKK